MVHDFMYVQYFKICIFVLLEGNDFATSSHCPPPQKKKTFKVNNAFVLCILMHYNLNNKKRSGLVTRAIPFSHLFCM